MEAGGAQLGRQYFNKDGEGRGQAVTPPNRMVGAVGLGHYDVSLASRTEIRRYDRSLFNRSTLSAVLDLKKEILLI